jgi:transcription elongation factor SPT5
VFFESLKGSIYVEAFKEANVREAIDGIASLRENGMKIVPLNEMTAVFNYDKVEKFDIKLNQWVRLKSGVYEGDLAQVIYIEDPINKILVRIIPRLGDPKRDDKVMRRVMKHPQKLFNPTGLNAEKNPNKHGYPDGCVTWNKMTFNSSGFLIKVVKAKSLVLDGVEPRLEELKIFNTFGSEGQGESQVYGIDNLFLEGVKNRKNKFIKGDKIKVTSSDLKNLTGVVENHSNGTVQIIPTNIEFNEILEIPEEFVVKNFLPGDNIKVKYFLI